VAFTAMFVYQRTRRGLRTVVKGIRDAITVSVAKYGCGNVVGRGGRYFVVVGLALVVVRGALRCGADQVVKGNIRSVVPALIVNAEPRTRADIEHPVRPQAILQAQFQANHAFVVQAACFHLQLTGGYASVGFEAEQIGTVEMKTGTDHGRAQVAIVTVFFGIEVMLGPQRLDRPAIRNTVANLDAGQGGIGGLVVVVPVGNVAGVLAGVGTKIQRLRGH